MAQIQAAELPRIEEPLQAHRKAWTGFVAGAYVAYQIAGQCLKSLDSW